MKVTIRPARAEDRDAVMAIAAQIWEGNDYLPQVWDAWLADREGQLVVATLGGRPVAVGKLTRLGPEEWWLEGLRVDPAHQGQGIARQVHAHLVELAEQRGRGVLRFGTGSYNQAVHHLAVRTGFHPIARYAFYRAEALGGPEEADERSPSEPEVGPLRPVPPSAAPAIWALLEASPRFQAGHRLYEERWVWRTLTAARLQALLARGRVWGMTDEAGDWVGVAFVLPDREKERLRVGLLDGEEAALRPLAQALRRQAAVGVGTAPMAASYSHVSVKVLDDPTLTAALEEAGYQSAWEHQVVVFERPLHPQHAARHRQHATRDAQYVIPK